MTRISWRPWRGILYRPIQMSSGKCHIYTVCAKGGVCVYVRGESMVSFPGLVELEFCTASEEHARPRKEGRGKAED